MALKLTSLIGIRYKLARVTPKKFKKYFILGRISLEKSKIGLLRVIIRVITRMFLFAKETKIQTDINSGFFSAKETKNPKKERIFST